MFTRLMFDRKWIVNHAGPCKPVGQYGFRVCPPAKPAAPVLTADQPWEGMSNGWGTLRIEDGRWRLWYEAWDEHYRDDFDGRLCYAESPDGVQWTKPALGLIDFNGSTANNIVIDGKMTGLGFHGSSVFVDPTSPPDARYRCIFMGGARPWDDRGWYALYPMSFAYSADGIRWTWGLPEPGTWVHPPVASFASDTQSVVWWDERARQYVGYFRNWDPSVGRTIGRSTTNTFGRWPHPETVLTADEADPFGQDLYNNAASRYEVAGDHAVFLFISVFDHDTDTLQIQVATSRDGKSFKRLCRDPFVAAGETFDRGGAYMCPGIHRVGDELVMLYHAVPYRHGEASPEKIRFAGSYVALRFPQDRIQGLHAEDFAGNVPFAGTGATLNATVAPGGRIRAGLLPAKDELAFLPGFAPEDCTPVTGDGTALPLQWAGGTPPAVEGGLEMRLYLEGATLYSYSCSG
jgi:hypothetical protein